MRNEPKGIKANRMDATLWLKEKPIRKWPSAAETRYCEAHGPKLCEDGEGTEHQEQ